MCIVYVSIWIFIRHHSLHHNQHFTMRNITTLLLFLAFCFDLSAQIDPPKIVPGTTPQDERVPAPKPAAPKPTPARPPQRTQPAPVNTENRPPEPTAPKEERVPVPQPPPTRPPQNTQPAPGNTASQPTESAAITAKRKLIADGYQVCMTHPDYGKVYCKKAQNKGERTTYYYIDEDGIAIPLDGQVVNPTAKKQDRPPSVSQPYAMPKMSRQLMASNQLTTGTYVGDIDGNGVDDILSCNGKELVIKQSDPAFSLLLTHTFPAPITRLVIGDFATGGRERGKKQVIALLNDGTTQAFAISDDGQALWWWFTQATFISAEERYFITNFDKEIDDEIMVHNPNTGKLRFYKRNAQGFFGEMPNFELGNLTGFDLRNVEIIVGKFFDNSEKEHLMVVDHNARKLILYASTLLENGTLTFWWAFTTRDNLFPAGSQLYAVNLDGGVRDGLLIRNGNDNSYTFFKVEFGDGNLVQETAVNTGQLPIRSGECKIVPAKVRDISMRGEKGGDKRDDILLTQLSDQQFIRTDARFDGNNLTYWWAFNNLIIGN
jgi:hypothetical protein